MINWIDRGVVLSSKRHGEKYRIINIFTREHGKVQAMASSFRNNTFATFSKVDISFSSKSRDSMGFWRLNSETQNWVYSMNLQNHLLVCQGICFLLNKLLPNGVKHEELFKFTECVLDNFQSFTEKEVLLLYAYFEVSILDYVGLSVRQGKTYLHKLNDLSNLNNILKTEGLYANARKFLTFARDIIGKNLSSIDNYYRSSIFRLI